MLASMDRNWKNWLGLAARLILGVSLAWAGLTKVGRLSANVDQVQLYELPIPGWIEVAVGYVQPPLEIIVGLLLIVGLFTRFNAILGTLAMAVFIAGITWAWSMGLSIDCGCFTDGGVLAEGEQHKYLEDILRDVFFMAAGIWLIIRPSSALSLDNYLFSTNADYSQSSELDD